jgi:hypothetical protein
MTFDEWTEIHRAFADSCDHVSDVREMHDLLDIIARFEREVRHTAGGEECPAWWGRPCTCDREARVMALVRGG